MTLGEYYDRYGPRIIQESERFFVDELLYPLLGENIGTVEPQYPFLDSTGRARRIDFVCRGSKRHLALEVNGETYHAEGVIPNEMFDDNLFRQNEILRAGYHLVRYSYSQLQDPHWRSLVMESLRDAIALAAPDLLSNYALEPNEIQREALDALEFHRNAMGWTRGIVVMPTGTGKTILSALLARNIGGRVLFLVHRLDILSQSCLGAQLAISVNNCPPPRDPRSRMTSVKRIQRKYVQKAYRVRNWREYETGLRARGSLTVWLGLTDGKLANWNSPRPTRRKPGRQRQYSNHAIETTVTLGLVFGLASRQTEGFLCSLLTLLNLDNDVPDHSTISRRKARLRKVASYERRTVKPVHLLIDSSGLSVHVGQLRTPPKARDDRKLHLAVDEQTSDVVACELTSQRARDASRVASLVGQIERPIASPKADAAYDTGDV